MIDPLKVYSCMCVVGLLMLLYPFTQGRKKQ